MIQGFTVDDGSTLCGLLADFAGDILIKTDAKGFVTEASPGLELLGFKLTELLFAPHLSDLAENSHAEMLRAYCCDALCGMPAVDRIEFPAINDENGQRAFCERWYALSLRPTVDPSGEITGGIGIMRSVERRRSLEGELLAASMTDQLTGLANRHAFMSMLSRLLGCGAGGSIILFGIDRFRGITLRYGQSKGDEVLWAFAQFLRAMLGNEPILTRLEGERFAVILPDIEPGSALSLAEETVLTFGQIASECGSDDTRVGASAGVTGLADHSDAVLASADLALTIAQAAGGMRAELGGEVPIIKERRKSA